MTRTCFAITLIALATAATSARAVTCADRAPAPIFAPAAEGQACQNAIAKAGEKFLAAKLKTLGKCKLKQPAGSCPTAKDASSIAKAVNQAMATISKACADDTAQAGLSSSYADETDDGIISSCMLSQHNVAADLLSAWSHGATTEPWPNTGKERAGCVKELSGSSTKFLAGALKNANKCIASQSKSGNPGDLAAVCLGSFAGGAFVPPADSKTADKQAKLVQKTADKIAKKCAPAAADIATLFACPGSETVEDLQNCVVCRGWDAVFDAAEQQHAETGAFLRNGPGALQLGVSAGTAAKLLIEPGTYQEEVTIPAGRDGLALVGCGGASENRPRIIPPATQVSGRGIQASGVDGLVFQSLDFFNQTNDHIRIAQANGLTFRDITGDGNRNTAYAVFPVFSNNILIELCKVRAQDDAPLYVGQSTNITVRFNDVRDGVAGAEIENSANAEVYGNYFTGNTAGLFLFLDGSLPVQLADCHSVHHNVSENNNEPNFGTGTVAGLPQGIGILVLSSDTTPYSYNISRDNGAGGLVIADQVIAGFGPPFSADQSVDGNYVFNNFLSGNGTRPGSDWPLPAGADLVFLTTQSSGNCESGNIFTSEIGFGAFASTTPPNANAGTCVLPPPAVFPGCPVPPLL
jgi:parallel beta-helix repeat protein